jgi:endonuclease III
MKKIAQYAKEIKQLISKLKKEKGKAALAPLEDPMQALLLGILCTYSSEQRAEAALTKLLASVVDLNELRVTSVAEMVTYLGLDFPSVRPAAEEISRALNAVFNRTHRLDLNALKTGSRKAAEVFLDTLDGVGAHAKATVMLRCLGEHVIPVDQHMLVFLQKNGCVPEDAQADDAQKLLVSQVSDRDAGGWYVALKRHAAAHTPRRLPVQKPPPRVAPPAPRPVESPAKPEPKGEPKVNVGDKAAPAKKAERATAAAEPARKAAASKARKEKPVSASKSSRADPPKKASSKK